MKKKSSTEQGEARIEDLSDDAIEFGRMVSQMDEHTQGVFRDLFKWIEVNQKAASESMRAFKDGDITRQQHEAAIKKATRKH